MFAPLSCITTHLFLNFISNHLLNQYIPEGFKVVDEAVVVLVYIVLSLNQQLEEGILGSNNSGKFSSFLRELDETLQKVCHD